MPPVETVSDPADVTALGITINELLTDWSPGEQAPPASGPLVRFDSLTALLKHVDLQGAFRFLYVLLGRFAAAGAVTHFYLDPGAHDDQTIATLRPLFDSTIEATGP